MTRSNTYVNELAHHFYMGAALADSDKAIRYCTAAGERALRLLAFEEAVGHLTRALEVAEKFGDADPSTRCDTLIALAEAQNRAGDAGQANANFERAAPWRDRSATPSGSPAPPCAPAP